MISNFSIWLTAIRPKTLPLASGAIILGSAIAHHDGFFNASIFILALLTAILLQIVSNLANDYGDAISGADTEERVGPKRVVQAGLVTKSAMQKALALVVTLTIISGVSLVLIAFPDDLLLVFCFILLGFSAIIAAITYTVGKSPYGYLGFGDISVFVFFGLVGVIGSYALYNTDIYWSLLLPASSCGLLAVSVLNINNLRDLKSDIKAGKYTFAARIGYKKAIVYHWIILLLAEVLILSYIYSNNLPNYTYLHLLVVPILINVAFKVKHYSDAPLMNQQLRNTSMMSFIFCGLFALGTFM